MASIKMDLTDRAKTRKVKIKPVMINMDITLQEQTDKDIRNLIAMVITNKVSIETVKIDLIKIDMGTILRVIIDMAKICGVKIKRDLMKKVITKKVKTEMVMIDQIQT